MVNPLSRFKPLDAPRARPGCCFICRGTQNGPFIDTGISVAFEGSVIICRACITQMFSQLNLGIVLNEDEIQARVLAAHDNGKIVGQEFVLESFREFLDSYKSPGLDALLTNLSLTTFVESSESESAEPTPSDGEPVADATDDTPSSVKSNGPNRKPRRSDVSRNTDDGSESDLSNVAINF